MGVDIKNCPKPIKAFFNGVAQVVFIENVISGMILLASFLIAGLEMNHWNWGDFNSWKFFVFEIIGVSLSTIVAKLIGCDEDAICSGLFGFCPSLVAIAAGVFSADWTTAWIFLLAGCIIVVPSQIVINRFTGHFGLPGFTFPFIVMVWFFILIGYHTDLLTFARQGVLVDGTASVGGWMAGTSSWTVNDWMLFATNGFEEIYVLDGVIASFMVLAAYFWYKWDFALKACIAMGFSVGFGMIFGASMNMMHYSLFGYSAILTVGGLDTFGKSRMNSGRYWFLFFLGLVLTCFINYAVTGVLGTFGLPNCTIAFVTAGWFILVLEHFMIEQEEKRKLAKNA